MLKLLPAVIVPSFNRRTKFIMGSSQSKQAYNKPAKVKSGGYQKVKNPSLNTWLAAESFGYATHFDDFMFKSHRVNVCFLCSRRLSLSDEIVVHNTDRCQASFHAQCMRCWLQRFIDSRGRHSRPRCVKCDRSLNIRQANGGRTKRNLVGDFKPF